MGKIKVLPDDFALQISESAKFPRNKIVHEYNHLERKKRLKTVDEALPQYTQYCGLCFGSLWKARNKLFFYFR